jgi:hypothetical protein
MKRIRLTGHGQSRFQSGKNTIRMKSDITFDPFTHRLSRDIRNSLSSAFSDTLCSLDTGALERCETTWLQTGLPDAMAAYISNRMQRYNRVIDHIRTHRISDARRQALLAWNERLFFEVHEVLEDLWHPATGALRKALQGLILAAGIGEHLHYGQSSAAQRLARRADQLLRTHREQLAFINNLDDLLDWLQDCNSPPPELRTD